jgi:hypothetical protein
MFPVAFSLQEQLSSPLGRQKVSFWEENVPAIYVVTIIEEIT